MSRRRAEQEAICLSLPRLSPELYPQEIQDFNEELHLDYHDDWLEGYRGRTKWVVLHRQVKDRWESETGEPMKPSCGVFFHHAALFKTHFGLDIHISHPYLDTNKPEYSNRFAEQYSQDNDYKLQTKVACLTLPISTTIDKEIHRSCVLHAETGTPLPLAVQAQIFGSSLARFTRALRILGFQTLAEDIIKEENMLASMDDTKRDSDAVVISEQTDEARDERSETSDGMVANVEACNFQWREGEVWTEPQILLLVQANDETTAQ